jgi:ribosome-binding factor A
MEQFYEILWSCVAVIASGLATWLVTFLTALINSKIKDKKLANILTSLTNLVMTVVQEVCQTYVDSMKKAGTFDSEAAKTAKNMALEKLKAQLTTEQKSYIESLGQSVEDYLSSAIESMIYQLKNK